MAKCTVCANVGVRKVVDGYLEDRVTGAGISRSLADLGLTLSPDVINRHKTHYAPPPERPKGTRKADFAAIVRDKAAEQFEGGELDLSEKDHVAGINAGLKAQAILDKREQVGKKQTQAETLVALLAALRGGGVPLALDDGMTIDGEAVEVEAL